MAFPPAIYTSTGDKIAGATGIGVKLRRAEGRRQRRSGRRRGGGSLLDSRDTLVLEYPDDDLAILRLISRLGPLLRLDLAHRAGGEHS